MTDTIDTPRSSSVRTKNQAARAMWSGFFGTAFEYYDNYIYASASALVFSKVFFPESGATGVLFSFASFAIAYLARPVGAFFAGHFSDKYGRRNTLLVILVAMGVATFAVGCIPTYDSIGLWAPALLVVFRIIQGLSVGGELPGSASLTMEHAPSNKRGLYAAVSGGGSTFGYVLAAGAFFVIAFLPEDQMLAWGWRILFWASALLVVLGVAVRWWVQESEAFTRVSEEGTRSRSPLLDALREQPRDMVRVIFSALQFVVATVVPVYGLAYATNIAGVESSTILLATIVAYLLAVLVYPLAGMLSDRLGRKPVLIAGNIMAAASTWVFFWAVSSQNVPMIYVGMILALSIAWGLIQAVYPVFYSEMFATRFRVTGFAVTLQIGLIFTGFSPLIIQALTAANGNAWWPAPLVVTVCATIAAISIGTARETFRSSITDEPRTPEARRADASDLS